jgi:hypothetical protein
VQRLGAYEQRGLQQQQQLLPWRPVLLLLLLLLLLLESALRPYAPSLRTGPLLCQVLQSPLPAPGAAAAERVAHPPLRGAHGSPARS